MICLDRIICVLLNDVACGRHQLVENSRIGRCPVSGHLRRPWGVLKGAGGEPTSGREIPFLGNQDVDNLPVLVDRLIQVDSSPATFTYVSFTNQRSLEACQQGRAASINSGVTRCTQR